MEGLFPLIIIVAGIISFLSKMKGQNQEDPRRSKPFIPPQLDPMHPKNFEKGKSLSRQATTVMKEQDPTHISESQTFTYEAKPVQIEQKSLSHQSEYVKKPSQERNITSLKNINKQKLVEGIIMAEVLGPPRALKPLHSSKHSTNKRLPN
jgi:hypothetical protein